MTGTNKACEIKLITKKIPYQINQKQFAKYYPQTKRLMSPLEDHTGGRKIIH